MKFAFLVAGLALLAGGYTLSAEGQTGRPSFVQMQDTDPALVPAQAAAQPQPAKQSRYCAHWNLVNAASHAGTSSATGFCNRSQSKEPSPNDVQASGNASSASAATQ